MDTVLFLCLRNGTALASPNFEILAVFACKIVGKIEMDDKAVALHCFNIESFYLNVSVEKLNNKIFNGYIFYLGFYS